MVPWPPVPKPKAPSGPFTVWKCAAPGPRGLTCDRGQHLDMRGKVEGRHQAMYGGQRVSWRTDAEDGEDFEF